MPDLSPSLVDFVGYWRQRLPDPVQKPQSGLFRVADLGDELIHCVLTLWHPRLREGRLFNFLVANEDDGWSRVGIANLNLHLFGRANTLNERLRVYASKRKSQQLKILVQPCQTGLDWLRKRGVLTIDPELWRTLTPNEAFLGHRTALLADLRARLQRPEGEAQERWPWSLDDVMSWAIESARSVHALHGMELARARQDCIDLLVASGGVPALSRASTDFTHWDDIRDHDPEAGRDAMLTLGRHRDLLESFLASLQALVHYEPQARCFCSGIHERTGDVAYRERGCSLILVAGMEARLQDHLPDGVEALSVFCDTVRAAVQQLWVPPATEGDEKRLSVLRRLLKREWELDEAANFIVQLVSAAALLSSDVHEGRPCSYGFMLGDGGIWRVVGETLSYEASGPRPPVEPFARLLKSHWSIFEQPRVAGLVEYADIPRYSDGSTLFLSSLVRLRQPEDGEELRGEIFRTATRNVPRSLAIHTKGDSHVLVYHDGSLAYRLDTKTGDEDDRPEQDMEDIVRTALRTAGLGEEGRMRQHVTRALRYALERVSEAPGEGCLIVFCANEGTARRYLGEMDREGNRMAWRSPDRLSGLDPAMLRALLILDGAVLISGDGIEPRLLVYPHEQCDACGHTHSFDAIRLLPSSSRRCGLLDRVEQYLADTDRLNSFRDSLLGLDGKGSKHHGAANLCTLLWYQRRLGAVGDFEILTVSADGPITQWTKQLTLA